MNDIQKEILEKITKNNEKVILNELLDFLIGNGLGSVTKREMDIYLFHLLDSNNTTQVLSNYDWSCLLKINERKVKNLRIENGIRYYSNDNNDERKQWLKLLGLIKDYYIETDDLGNYVIIVEDPYLLRFLEHQIKLLKLASTDYSFNPERVKFKQSSLEVLLKSAAECFGIDGHSKAQDILSKMKWKKYGKKVGEELYDIFKKAFSKFLIPAP